MELLIMILLVLLPLYFGLFRNNLVLEYRKKVLNQQGVEGWKKLPSYERMMFDFINWSDLKLYTRNV